MSKKKVAEPETTYKATHIRDEMYMLHTYGYAKSPAGKPVKILMGSEKLIMSLAKQRVAGHQAGTRRAKAVVEALKAAKKK